MSPPRGAAPSTMHWFLCCYKFRAWELDDIQKTLGRRIHWILHIGDFLELLYTFLHLTGHGVHISLAFVNNGRLFSKVGCNALCSLWHGMRIPFTPCCLPNLVLSAIFILVILMGMALMPCGVLICIFLVSSEVSTFHKFLGYLHFLLSELPIGHFSMIFFLILS